MPLPNLPVLKKNLPLIIAAITALLAVVLINLYIRQQAELEKKKLAEKQKNFLKVIVATQNIPRGAQITEKMISEETIHKDKLAPSAATSAVTVLNKVAFTPISKGEQILSNKIGIAQKVEHKLSLSAVIPPGKRAVTIPVDNIASLSGMIRPSDYVDVVGMLSISTKMTILPLLQNILVLAVGQELTAATDSVGTQKTGSVSSTITLALSPQEANLVTFISEQGKIRLILRSSKDRGAQYVTPTDWDSVLRMVLPAEKKLPGRKVEIYHGTKKEVKTIE